VSGKRQRSVQFKVYFSAEEKAQLFALAHSMRRLPSEVIRELLEREVTRRAKATSEETRSPTKAAESVDEWIRERRARRANFLRTGR
jgi:hypothetical protein